MMNGKIDKFYIRENGYNNQLVKVIKVDDSVLYGVIIDEKDNFCLFVRNPDLM